MEKTRLLFFAVLPFLLLVSAADKQPIVEREKSGSATAQPPVKQLQDRPRVIVSTDIGGTDPDDFQSMIHYLMYADRFETEGLIASPYGKGRKADILRMIDLYEKDLPKLKKHSAHFPSPEALRNVTKQGAKDRAPGKGWSTPTEGSEWIVKCARKDSPKPLWVLVWGGLDDLAQALHDAPDIADKLRVYWIGGPNKKWSADVYAYLASNFPDLWMIEANATYRGWFVGGEKDEKIGNLNFYKNYIRGKGAFGKDFGNYYGGEIKMGDTPSVAYLLHGEPERPDMPSWGGSFQPLHHSSRRIFERETSLADHIPVFGLIEWVWKGPDTGPARDEACFWLEIDGQQFEGFYEGNGRYRARYVTKKVGEWTYRLSSPIAELDGRTGQFTSVDPWPGKAHPQNIQTRKWWSDRQDPELYEGPHQGARTVSRWREAFLMDWANRWSWLAETESSGMAETERRGTVAAE